MQTMNDLFILEGMKESVVIAGQRGLTRHVHFVNISDTPDVIRFVDKDHLLLTTGYSFRNAPQEMCELIQQMHDKNCAGLVIKVDRFIKELPLEVKLVADDLDFPIIDLPTALTLGELSFNILNYLNNRKYQQLHYALNVQKEFSNMMIEEYSFTALIEQLGSVLRRPTILLNHRGEPIAQSNDFNQIYLKPAKEEIIRQVKKDLPASRKGTCFNILLESNQNVTIYPIKTKRKHNSMLVIIDALTLPYPTSQMSIEQAGMVIAFALIKEQAIRENTSLLEKNFFTDVIERRIYTEEEILNRSEFYGLQADMNTVCIVCNIDALTQDYKTMHLYEKKIGELHHHIYEQLEDEMINFNMKGTLFTKEKYFVVLLQFSIYTEREIKYIREFIETTQKNIQIHGDFSVSFGVSNQIQSLIDIPVAHQEAIEMIKNGYATNLSGFIHFYKTKEIDELLNTIPKKDLKSIYENTLKSLAYPKTKEEIELVHTIKTFLDCQCEISETARKLFVHRNTVKYRVAKTEEMLNRSFRDPVDSLNIRVALMIGSILHEQEAVRQQ